MEIVKININSLTPYEKNAKLPPREQIEQIKKSILKYQMCDPIGVWGDKNIIVEGHGRYLALLELGATDVECIRLDHLSDKERKEYTLVHNKTTMDTGFDLDILSDELLDIDLGDFNFDFGIDEDKNDEVQEVDVPEIDETTEPQAKFGDIYQLGNHRLMCGDSTKPEMFEKLLDGVEVDCVCTDPPYNMGYVGAGRTPKEKRKTNKIANDNLPKEKFEAFLVAVYKCLYQSMKDGASFYVFYKELGEGTFIRLLEQAGLTYKQELIWVKSQLVLGGAKYQNMYEPCLFGCKGKSTKFWYGGRKNRSVIEHIDLMDENELRQALKDLLETIDTDIIREKKVVVNDLHPTMKPIKLLAKLLRNSTRQGDNVLDAFGGSGSTLMACEQIGRSCYMMEFEPKYVDVIIKRWEEFTGKKAVKL